MSQDQETREMNLINQLDAESIKTILRNYYSERGNTSEAVENNLLQTIDALKFDLLGLVLNNEIDEILLIIEINS